MKNKYLIITLIISFFYLSNFETSAQTTTIKGVAHNQPEMAVKIITFADNFSNLETTIASTKTKQDGSFLLNFSTPYTQFSYLAIGMDRGEFYISPNSSYNVDIPYDTLKSSGSIFDRLPLMFNLISHDAGIQNAIQDYNIKYNDFLYTNSTSIYRGRNKSVVTSFIDKIESDNAKYSSEFVENYIHYSLVSLMWLSKKESNKKILSNFLINKPVLYNNIQYCDFFKEFFKVYFDVEKTFRYEEIVDAINIGNSASAVIDLIARDSLIMEDSRITELNAMLLLSQYYFDRYVEKSMVIKKLQELADNSSFTENKQIALNFITKITELDNGTIAPDFVLTDIEGISHSLSEMRGDFVLLSFFRNDCRICTFQIDQLSEIQINTNIKVVVISAGIPESNDPMVQKIVDLKWTLLQTGNDVSVLENYKIKVYPTYILVNPDGTIGYVHLPMPQENMQLYISRFIDRYNSKIKENNQ